ncbi:MAG: OmpA/MotB domain protein [Bacteroidetes bacterium]|jgi:outer membrane protein OmpA-like peptidoglycan-associated protein|nr:OmpA/MotB domain protein [Bacteroidota bacterium]MDF2453298.1 OmpA/MotB domain protein [Bacteroidota bacterium]
MKNLILLASLFLVFSLKAQKADKLRVGEKIPFSRIVVLNQDQKPTNIDLPNGKNTTDRFVLVYFFSSEKSIKELIAFNNDVERILNKYQNNSCKGASDIEYVTICIEKDFIKWQTLLTEANYNKSKFTGKKTNYLAENGLKDKAVSAFKVSEMPSLFLVNPKGRLYLETDSFEVLEKTFQNICKVNAAYSTADISGKLLIGEKSKSPLTQHNVYLVKGNADTITKTSTDGYGDFVFKQVDTTQNLSIRIEQNAKTKGGPKVFLAKQNGEIVSEFKKNSSGNFEYKLLSVDVEKLSELEEDDDITMKYKKFNSTNKKDLTVTENIYYELAKYNLVTESEIVLDKVLLILKANPNVKLEVISHTDAQGDDAGNLKLSENRSNAVIGYLVNKGVNQSRLKGIGKGELEIRNRCANGVSCSDKEQEYNRRTEFKFIKN